MSSPVDQIKERLSIDEVISDYIKLTKAGASFKAKCPFHGDNDPSLSISPDKGVWHCFGCSAGGDHFEFVKQIEGVEFPEALRILAKRAGVQLKAPNPKEETKKNRIFRLNELALKYFSEALNRSQGGRAALAYLKDRGLTQETIDKFQIGYAPFSWHGLSRFLRAQGFEDRHIAEAGLAVNKALSQAEVISTEGEMIYDRFRARIMFPVISSSGAVLGFSGRIFEAALPEKEKQKDYGKYINSPNTLVFNKSRSLYGLNQARAAIRKQDQAVFVEGQLDVVLSYQAGIENVVAASGTALSHEHLNILKRLTKNLVFCFDADQAGQRAAREAVKKALAQGISVKLIALPEGKDPADIVKGSPAKWQILVKKAQPAIEYFMDLAFLQTNPEGLEGKKQILADIFDILAATPSQIDRDYWLKELSTRLEQREQAVREEFQNFLNQQFRFDNVLQKYEDKTKEFVKSPSQDRTYHLEANFLSILLQFPDLGKDIEDQLRSVQFVNSGFEEIFNKFVKLQASDSWQRENWQKQFNNHESLINQLRVRAERYFNNRRQAQRELSLCLEVFQEQAKKQRVIQQLTQK